MFDIASKMATQFCYPEANKFSPYAISRTVKKFVFNIIFKCNFHVLRRVFFSVFSDWKSAPLSSSMQATCPAHPKIQRTVSQRNMKRFKCASLIWK